MTSGIFVIKMQKLTSEPLLTEV